MMRISIKTSTLFLEGDMSKGAKFVMHIIVSIETRLESLYRRYGFQTVETPTLFVKGDTRMVRYPK